MNCCVCLSDRREPFLEKNGYRIVRCQGCGFLYVDPRPTPAEIEAFYQDPDYFQGGGEYGYVSYTEGQRMIEQQAEERLDLIERFVGCGRLLDVGCASGYFLHVAKQRGWQIEGVELSRVVVPSAEQLLGQRLYPTLEAAPFAPASFDVVTLWEYIEHLPDPRAELHRVRRLLKPGGLLALSTPNAGQRRVRREPRAWPEFKPPEHLGFFTIRTLDGLLRACAYEPLFVRGIAPEIRPSLRIEQWIDRLRRRLGDRHTRSTPLWWTYSIARRILLAPTVLHHRFFLPRLGYCKGIEMYARKISGDTVEALCSGPGG